MAFKRSGVRSPFGPSKRCSRCHKTKYLGEFHRFTKAKDGRQAQCKLCYRATDRKRWRQEKRRITEVKKRRRAQIRMWFQKYKTALICSCCPERDPACLTFHHRKPANKHFDVSDGVTKGKAIVVIIREIAKCDVLCANCHLKLESKVRLDVG